jgi:hypothetical protein
MPEARFQHDPETEALAPRLSGTSHLESLEVPALDDFALCAQIIGAGMTGQSSCTAV